MILSSKLLATIFVLFTSTLFIGSINASNDFTDDDDDKIDSSVEDTAADSLLLTREVASAFNDDEDEKEKQGSLLKTLVRRKLDAEEIQEIKLKSEARRRKAYENYEDACKVKGKFTERSCPKLADCYAKNKLPFVPIATPKPMTTAVAITSTALAIRPAVKPKVGREFILREWANQFLDPNDDEDNDDDDGEDELAETNDTVAKRFLKSKTSELAEESNERRNKAFKKYEEYCEKRIFRIGSERNCPSLNKKLC